LFPGLGFTAFILFMTASLGIAFAKPYGTGVGWLTFALSTSIIILGALVQSPSIRITSRQIQVDLASIDLAYVGRIENLPPEKLDYASKNPSSKSAYLVLRPGIESSVILEITDTMDAHPYWHFSTRKPAKVSKILNDLKPKSQ
jgi:hypothetical protein